MEKKGEKPHFFVCSYLRPHVLLRNDRQQPILTLFLVGFPIYTAGSTISMSKRHALLSFLSFLVLWV